MPALAPNSQLFPDGRIKASSTLLVRYGLATLGVFRTTDGISRRYLFGDLRKTEQLNFSQLSFLLKLARHVPPNDQKLSGGNIRFAELDIPRELAAYRPQLSNISSFIPPEHEMANWVQKEIAMASAKDPPYAPYLNPKLFEPPWVPIDTDHKAARTRWIGYSEQARRTLLPQELSIQAFSLYQIRFVLSADLCKAWSCLGGLGPQLSHLSTIWHLAITETVGTALAYRRLVPNKLQELARKRSAAISDFTSLLSVENSTLKEQAKKEVS